VVSMRRMRQAVRQVFAQRTSRLSDDGVELATADTRTLYAWSAIDRAEESGGLILLWAGHILASTVPVRAFSSAAEALAFLAECRRRAASRAPAADA
jgi:YcxB-like protein